MKKYLLAVLMAFPTVCQGAFTTDWLRNTTSSFTVNGTTYTWQAGTGGSGQFLQNNNGVITSATPSGSGGGSGYTTVQDEGISLVNRSTVNFIGQSISCVDNAGTLTTDCTVTSAGGGGSSLAVKLNGVTVSSPTAVINLLAPFLAVLTGGATAQLAIDTTSASGLITNSSATATFFPIISSTTLLTISSATANYLTLSSAAATYVNKLSPLTSGSTSYIQNTNTLQTGSTFYVSSGTVSGPLSLYGSFYVDRPDLGGNGSNRVTYFMDPANDSGLINITGWAGDTPIGISAFNGIGQNVGNEFFTEGGGGATYTVQVSSCAACTQKTRINVVGVGGNMSFNDFAGTPMLSFSAQRASTFTTTVYISTLTVGNQLKDSAGSAGTTGFVATSGGPTGNWTWQAASGGGGSSSLAVGTGTASNFTTNVTSPTAAISFLGSQFQSTSVGTTNFIALAGSGFINNQNSLQTGATFYVSSGTVDQALTINGNQGVSGMSVVDRGLTVNNGSYSSTGSSASFIVNGAVGPMFTVDPVANLITSTAPVKISSTVADGSGSVGTTGQVYTSRGAGLYPTWQAAAAGGGGTTIWGQYNEAVISNTVSSFTTNGVIKSSVTASNKYAVFLNYDTTQFSNLASTFTANSSTFTLLGPSIDLGTETTGVYVASGTAGSGILLTGTNNVASAAPIISADTTFLMTQSSSTANDLKLSSASATYLNKLSPYVSSITVTAALTLTGTNNVGSAAPILGDNASSVAVLSAGLIPNSEIDGSSITKQGLLLAGSNITLTPGAGTLTIASTGGSATASGPGGAVQIASGTALSNVANFVYSTGTATLNVPGILITSGTITGMSTIQRGLTINVGTYTVAGASAAFIVQGIVNGSTVPIFQIDPATNIVTSTVPLTCAAGLTISSNSTSGNLTYSPSVGGILISTSIQVNGPIIANSPTVAVSTINYGLVVGGHIEVSSTTPVVSSCGSTPNPSISGNDQSGVITVGGGSVTACTLTFAVPYVNTPSCVFMSTVSISGFTRSASAQTINTAGSFIGATIPYICQGYR